MKVHFPVLALFSVLFAGCGGGGGGGGGSGSAAPPPLVRPPTPTFVYQGNEAPAVIDESNGKLLATDAFAAIITVRELSDLFVDPAGRTGDINEIRSGPSGGQARIRGRMNGGTGWLSIDYEGYQDSGLTLDGLLVQELRSPLMLGSEIDGILEFTDLRIQDVGTDISLRGSIDRVFNSSSMGSDQVLANLLVEEVTSGDSGWIDGVALDQLNEGDLYSGRIYDSSAGYVDLSTSARMIYFGSEQFPERGGILRCDAGTSAVLLDPLNHLYVGVILDVDGDGSGESVARLEWQRVLDGTFAPSGNSPATASAGEDQTFSVGERIELRGGFSYDGDESFLTVNWRLLASPPGSTATLVDADSVNPSFAPDLPGEYLFLVHAGDPDGDAIDTKRVVAVAGASPSRARDPVLRFDIRRPIVLGQTVEASAMSSSRDSNGNLSVSWGFDAPPGSGAAISRMDLVASFVPDVPGFYTLRPDILGASTSQTERVIGAGAGFQISQNVKLATNVSNKEPVLLDLNADGSLDIATVSNPAFDVETRDTISVYFQESGGFSAPQDFQVSTEIMRNPAGADGSAPAAGDINSDGVADLVAISDQALSVIYGSSSTWTPIQIPTALSLCNGVELHITDVDGDARNDILLLQLCLAPTARIWLQQSDGSLGAEVDFAAPGLGRGTAFGDLNGDGRADAAAPGDGSTSIYLGQGDGTFLLDSTITNSGFSNQVSATVADFTADGLADLILVEFDRLVLVPQGAAGVLLNPTVYEVDGGLEPAAVADFDADGRPDILVPDFGLPGSFALQSADGSFQILPIANLAVIPFVPGDLNGDGLADLLSVDPGNGDGVFLRFALPGN